MITLAELSPATTRRQGEPGFLAPTGILITATPRLEHLRELIRPLRMPTIDPHKPERRAVTFHELDHLGSRLVTYGLSLDHAKVQALAGMGPAERAIGSAPPKRRSDAVTRCVPVSTAVGGRRS
jgi:hypothetical protein